MADYAITATSVLPTTTTVYGRGISGATITAGQSLYMDASDSNKIKLAANTTALTAAVIGIAMNAATSGQPVTFASGGDITLNAVLTAATAAVLGNSAGALSDDTDLNSSSGTRYGSIVGIGTTTTNLKIQITNSGVLNP